MTEGSTDRITQPHGCRRRRPSSTASPTGRRRDDARAAIDLIREVTGGATRMSGQRR